MGAYDALTAGRDGEGSARRPLVTPGSATTSPLIWQLFGRDTSQTPDAGTSTITLIAPGHLDLLSDEERRVFTEWIDLGAQWDLPPESSVDQQGDARP